MNGLISIVNGSFCLVLFQFGHNVAPRYTRMTHPFYNQLKVALTTLQVYFKQLIESYMGRGVRQVCPTRGPAGAGADPSTGLVWFLKFSAFDMFIDVELG